MTWERKKSLPTPRRTRRRTGYGSMAALGIALICVFPAALTAQQAPIAVYVAGNAAVTGFSGALPPVQIAPGVDPGTQTFIDLNGPSLRIVDLHHMNGPMEAQLVGAPKPFTFSAAQLGQVFGVALDDNELPNIYTAASSAYGLPIVAPGSDGKPQHIQAGAPNATLMPGLWGPQGGPGSIWKIDGTTGSVSLFATVTLNGRSNSGAALGGLAYDPDSKSLYVADRESGIIHRFDMNGRDLGSYDHGVTGRAAQRLPPVPWTSQQPVNVTSPQFDSAQPATWNYAAPERRVFGVAVHQGRLYYAVADSLQIWSVGLKPDGSFGNDAVIEIAVPPSTGPTEISKITFDEQGRMFLADRPAPTGTFDFEALAVPAIGRVLRYEVIGTTPDGRRIWQQQPDEYAIGFPPDFRNGNGGVAIGYNYDHNGELAPGSCGGFMWTTGEELRHTSDAVLAARLGRSGALDVDGLQGNGTWRIRHNDEPPLETYFIDYDDEFDDPAERGHMGDIAIERLCSPAQRASLMPTPGGGVPPQAGNPPGTPPPPPPPPPGGCLPGQLRRAGTTECGGCPPPGIQIGGICCSVTQIAATAVCSNSSCPPGQTPIGPSNFCCPSGQVYSGAGGAQACCSGPLVNGKCPTPPPPCTPSPTNPSCCPKGYVSTGNSCCLASKMTSTGICCPAGQAPGGPNKSQCEKIVLIPIKLPPGPQCCASGIPTASGKCCPPGNVTTSGVCCPDPVDPTNRKECRVLIPLASCASGYTKMPNGSCCNNRYVSEDGKSCRSGQSSTPLVPLVPLVPRACPPGTVRDRNGDCVRRRTPACAPGEIRMSNGECVRRGRPPCPPGMVRTPRGICIRVGPPPRFGGPRRFGPPIGAPGGGPPRLLR
jgi:hypothetical protein